MNEVASASGSANYVKLAGETGNQGANATCCVWLYRMVTEVRDCLCLCVLRRPDTTEYTAVQRAVALGEVSSWQLNLDGSPVTAQKQLADQPAAPLQPNKSEEPDPKNAISPVKNEQLRSPRYSNKDIFHVLDDLIRFLEQQELACKDRSYKNAQW